MTGYVEELASVGACACVADAEWFPAPADGAASSRLLWPCDSRDDCAHNGDCGRDGASSPWFSGWRSRK